MSVQQLFLPYSHLHTQMSKIVWGKRKEVHWGIYERNKVS